MNPQEEKWRPVASRASRLYRVRMGSRRGVSSKEKKRLREQEVAASWRTVPSKSLLKKHPPWKKPLGEACPHGREILLVDGPYIRNTYSSDFVQGDNGYHSPRFVPKNELWVDASMPEEERACVAFHECHEAELMKDGLDYEEAHDEAKRLEDQFRKIHRPGEGKL